MSSSCVRYIILYHIYSCIMYVGNTHMSTLGLHFFLGGGRYHSFGVALKGGSELTEQTAFWIEFFNFFTCPGWRAGWNFSVCPKWFSATIFWIWPTKPPDWSSIFRPKMPSRGGCRRDCHLYKSQRLSDGRKEREGEGYKGRWQRGGEGGGGGGVFFGEMQVRVMV